MIDHPVYHSWRERLCALGAVCVLLFAGSARAENFERCLDAVRGVKPGLIVKVELRRTNDELIYEFDIRDSRGDDWDLACRRADGHVIEIEREVTSVLHPDFARYARHGESAARRTALELVSGLVHEVEYEIEEDGRCVYEFDIIDPDGVEHKLEFDAADLSLIEQSIELWQVGLE